MADPAAVDAVPLPMARAETLEPGEGKWRAVFDYALDAILIADDGRRFVDANAAACELLGAPHERIVGAPISEYISLPDDVGSPDPGLRWDAFLSAGREANECLILRPDGTRRFADFRARANFQPGFHLCIAHDGTERKLTEEAVRCAETLYRTLVETTNTGYLVADQDGRVVDANAEYVRLSGHANLNAIRGRNVLQWTAPADRDRHAAGIAACFREGAVRDLEIRFVSDSGQLVPVEINATAVSSEAGWRFLSLCRDITLRENARHEVETVWHELESRVEQRTAQLAQASEQIRVRARQQEAVAEFGRRALACDDLDHLLRGAGEMVARLLEVEFTAIMEHADARTGQLVLRACHGWTGRLNQPVATTDPATLAGYVLQSGRSVVIADMNQEKRFVLPAIMRERGLVSGITVVIPGEERPFGIIGAHTVHQRDFTQDDLHFVQSVANVLAAAVERTRAEGIVRLAREAAVKANDAKLDFLSRMSHELRTPLNAILGFGQLLEIEELGARQQESVDQIISAGRHLLHLVNEVLDISRIESGRFSFEFEPLAVEDLLGEAIDLMRPLASAEGLAITISPPAMPGSAHVLGDHQRVRQVLLNLLSNAVKYNRPGGEVRVCAVPAPDGRSVRLEVVDTGVGIPAENLPRLFTPFDRLGAENTPVEGSGIGLALSKRLMEAQGGQLGVRSTEGKGSTFWIDLPVAAAPAAESSRLRFDEASHPLPAGPAASPANGIPAAEDGLLRRTILYIEDNEQNRRLMELLLSQRPRLRLVTASRGGEGLDLARQQHPDLILLDVHLPDTSGEQVLNALRADASTRQTPIVVVSADATPIRQASLRALGANDYLTKPFNVKEFLGVVDTYLNRDIAEVASKAS
jgi:PAS domain S-box-containing protein